MATIHKAAKTGRSSANPAVESPAWPSSGLCDSRREPPHWLDEPALQGQDGSHGAVATGARITMLKGFCGKVDLRQVNAGFLPVPQLISHLAGQLTIARMVANAHALFAGQRGDMPESTTNCSDSIIASGPEYSRQCNWLRLGERIAVRTLVDKISASAAPMIMHFISFDDDWIMLAVGAGDRSPGNGSVLAGAGVQMLVWPHHNRRPGWTRRSFGSDKFNREARAEAALWLERLQPANFDPRKND